MVNYDLHPLGKILLAFHLPGLAVRLAYLRDALQANRVGDETALAKAWRLLRRPFSTNQSETQEERGQPRRRGHAPP